MTAAWKEEYRSFRQRDLSEKDYVYVWADGVHFRVRLEEDRSRYWPIQLDIRKLNDLKWKSSPTGQYQVFAMTRRLTRSGCLRAKSRPIGPPQSFMNRVMSRRSRWSSRAARRCA